MKRDYETLSPAWRGNLHTLLAQAEGAERRYGLSWYSDARDIVSKQATEFGVSVETAAGVMAALSPGNPWLRNIDDTKDFLLTYKSVGKKILGNRFKYGVYGRKNKMKAFKICAGHDPRDILGGNKVRAFYECILNPGNTEHVTIDGHAKCAAYNQRLGLHLVTVQPAEYRHIAAAYRQVAWESNLVPCQAQAIVWLAWRRKHGIDWLPDERQLDIWGNNAIAS